jgi:hypothetical protein
MFKFALLARLGCAVIVNETRTVVGRSRRCGDVPVHKTDSRLGVVIDARGSPGGVRRLHREVGLLALSPFLNIAISARQYFSNANHLSGFALPPCINLNNVPNSVRFQKLNRKPGPGTETDEVTRTRVRKMKNGTTSSLNALESCVNQLQA